MGYKILVADDSQTIQKVISLATKEQDFNLVSCLDENELFDNLNKNADLVLLDFALSDDVSGYELCKKIKDSEPSVPVMAMLGVFDSVDEDEFANSGFSDRIVKPFETEKFINQCLALLNNEQTEQEDISEDEHEGWSVDGDASDDIDEDETTEITLDSSQAQEQNDDLTQELSGWGFDPNELMKKDVTQHFDEFPPVIEDEVEQETNEESLEESTEDDYIDRTQEMELPDLSDEPEDATKEYDLSELKLEKDVKPVEDTQVSLDEEDEFDDLKSELVDELDNELGDGGLWAVDENIDTEPAVNQVENDHGQEENISENITLVKEGPVEQEIHQSMSSLPDGLEEALRKDLEPLVEKYVKDYCEKEVERLIWEIIPDLAENVIKKELSTIRETVISSMKN